MFTSYTLEIYHGYLKIAIIFERRYMFKKKTSFLGIYLKFQGVFFSLYMSVMCHISHLSRSDRIIYTGDVEPPEPSEASLLSIGLSGEGRGGGHHGWSPWLVVKMETTCLCFSFPGRFWWCISIFLFEFESSVFVETEWIFWGLFFFVLLLEEDLKYLQTYVLGIEMSWQG